MNVLQQEWISRYLEGSLAESDRRSFCVELQNDMDLRHAFLDQWQIHSEIEFLLNNNQAADKLAKDHLLYFLRANQSADVFAARLQPVMRKEAGIEVSPARRKMFVLITLAAAASLAIVAGGVWFGLRTTGAPAVSMGLRVAEASGQWSVVSGQWSVGGGENIQQPTPNNQHPSGTRVVVGMEIRQGERVVVKDGGKVGLKYDGEATTIELLAATEAGFGIEKGAKRVTLTAGKLVCAAAPQKQPFRIQTPQAVAEVVGTRFSLNVASALTTLAVQEGKVALIQEEKRLDVNAGETATAGDAGMEMVQTQGGSVWAWGSNYSGQLGDGTINTSAPPVRIDTPVPVKMADGSLLNDVVAAACGAGYTMALRADGSVWNWGRQSVDSNSPCLLYPVPVKMADGRALSEVTAIAAGNSRSVALRRDHTVWAWGRDANGNLSNGAMQSNPFPEKVPGLPDIAGIAAGGSDTCALATDSSVWTWGEDVGRNGPARVKQLNGNQLLSGVVAISVGFNHKVALKKDGSVWSWGSGDYGELGNRMMHTSFAVQVKMEDGSPLGGIIAIAGGYKCTVAQKADLSIWTWGTKGQILAGELAALRTPVEVKLPDSIPLHEILAIAAGSQQHRILVVTRDGTCWGLIDEQVCQSDDGKKVLQVQATQVHGLSNVSYVAAGVSHNLALTK